MKTVISARRKFFDLGFRELFKYRELLLTLSTRDVKLKYQQTLLGIIWVVLQPILTSVIFSAIFGKLAKLPSDNLPYALFSLAGMLPWTLFRESVEKAGRSILRETNLIGKVKFPRIIIPMSNVLSNLVDFCMVLAATLVIFAFYGVFPTWRLALLPLLMIPVLMLAMGLGLAVAALSTYYRDFIYIVPFALQIVLYISPIAYSSTLIPEKWALLYTLNPIVGVVESFRWALLGSEKFPTESMAISIIVGVVFLLVGSLVFKRIEDNFADVI